MNQARNFKLLVIKALILCSFLSACGGEYQAEKLFWKAGQIHMRVVKGDQEGENKYLEIRQAFQKVIDKYPDSVKAAESQIIIGGLYGVEKEYNKAMDAYQQVLLNYPDQQVMVARARLGKAKIREAEGDWEEALRLFKEVILEHGSTLVALEIPLYIARKYRKDQDYDLAGKYYREAIQQYDQLILKYPHSSLALSAMGFLSRCYLETGQWKEALRVLEIVRKDFPNTAEAKRAKETQRDIFLKLKELKE